MFLFLVHFFQQLVKRFSNFKSKITHSFHKEKDPDDNFTEPST